MRKKLIFKVRQLLKNQILWLKSYNFSNGFTLIELLISFTIIAVMVTIIFSAFRIGIRAYEKGEKDIAKNQRNRIIIDLLKRQLESSCIKKNSKNNTEFYLKGDNKSLFFVSNLSLFPDNDLGPVYVKYRVDKDEFDKEKLLLFEKNTVKMDVEKKEIELNKKESKDEDDIEKRMPQNFYTLISDAYNIEFEYLKERSDKLGEVWEKDWNKKNDNNINIDKGFPIAIRVIFQERLNTAPIVLFVFRLFLPIPSKR